MSPCIVLLKLFKKKKNVIQYNKVICCINLLGSDLEKTSASISFLKIKTHWSFQHFSLISTIQAPLQTYSIYHSGYYANIFNLPLWLLCKHIQFTNLVINANIFNLPLMQTYSIYHSDYYANIFK